MGNSRSSLVVYLLVLTTGLVRAQTVSGASVQPQQTSITLPAGNPFYIYGMATGGNFSSSNFSLGAFCQLVDANGNVNAGIALTTSDSNSFSTSAAYFTVGGVAVSGSATLSEYCAANNNPGATGVSDTFNLTQPSLVVVVGLSGGEASLTLSGPPGLQIDAQAGNTSGGVIPMVIAHANLSAGTYTVAESSSPSPAPGQDPKNMGDLIGVFVFPSTTTAPPVISGSPSSADQGQTITLTGTGFLASNFVWVGSPGYGLQGIKVASTNGTTLTFALYTDVFHLGVNTLFVGNANGNSNSVTIKVSH